MSAERRRILRVVLSVVLLLLGAFFAISVDRDISFETAPEYSASLFDEPHFSIRLGRNQLLLTGTTVSDEHEAALLQLVDEQLNSTDARTQFKPAIGFAKNWEAISTRLLYLVAATDSADATIDANGILIRGTTRDTANYEKRLTFLRAAMTAGRTLNSDIIVVDETPLDTLCRRNFASLNTESISFRQSSTSVRFSSYPLLDRLAEFAFECQTQKIAIIGHSDATGSEPWNIQVSRARAQAVADHLIENGVAPERFVIDGRGSSLPVADNETVHGREQNRRIEIELL